MPARHMPFRVLTEKPQPARGAAPRRSSQSRSSALWAGGLRHAAVVSAALAALFLYGSLAGAATPTLYVDRGDSACSDSGSGTAAQPFCSIASAAAKVTAGQTVQVAAGTYPERVTVASSGTSVAPITFTAAPGATVTVSGQTNGFYISGRSWVTVDGFNVSKTVDHGIAVSSSSNITLSNNHVSYSGQPVSGQTKSGIYLSNVSDSGVSTNTVDHNTSYGINVVSGSTRNTVKGNKSFSNAMQYQRAASGIRFYSAPGNTVASNICHDNEDSGIEFDTSAGNSLVYDNSAYNNGDHGIDNYKSTGQRLISNSVYKNVTAGINVEGGSTGATVANNISVDNGIQSPRTHSNIRVESGSTSGTTMDDDLVNLTTADTMLIWNSVSYSSLAAFRSATGQETHGIQGDPKWSNAVAGDLHLSAGSPAIDSADSGVSGQPPADLDGVVRTDDPDTPNTGQGPRGYDDRGAYEYAGPSGPPSDSPPAASLTVTPSSPGSLAVSADASASTDPDATPIATYSFDFGDGSPVGTQSGASAPHTYTSAGTYTVTVTVTDTAGLSSTATATVKVGASDAPPSAAVTVSPASGTVNLGVTADASASTDTDDTPIASYSFDFGDGSSAVGPQQAATATHTYTKPGTYTVTVTVKDTAGLTSTATTQVSVTDAPPSARLTVSPSNGKAPLPVTADASSSTDSDATPIASYSFDFGDGSAAVGPQPGSTASHTYTKGGSYSVTVTVTDTAGQASAATKRIKVR